VANDNGERNGAGALRLRLPQFELKDHGAGGRHTLVLIGELDMSWSPALDATIDRLCTEETEAIVLDLSGLTFMDSTGLRAVLLAAERCERHRCELTVIPGPPQVQRLFEVTGLSGRLSLDVATAELKHPPDEDGSLPAGPAC
jgi:anti-sigma B factor antagonist